MTRPRPLVTAVVAFAVANLGAGCTPDDPAPEPSPSLTPAIVVADASSVPGSVDGLPSIDPASYEALVGDVRGTPLVVNFWATWCEPCEQEMPLLAEAARTHRRSIQFLGIDILDARESARAFLRRLGVPYPNAFDASGATRDAVGSVGQPVTVFYDSEGRIVAKVDGPLAPTDLEDHLAALLP